MTKFCTVLLSISLACLSCYSVAANKIASADVPTPSSSSFQDNEAQSAQPQTVACPSQKFSTFLTAFRNDVSIQKQFTKIPLIWSDYRDDYEKATVVNKSAQQIKWPLISTIVAQRTSRFSQKTRSLPDGGRKVRIAASDSDDYIMEYSFYMTKGCWQLTRVDDLTVY